jgi:hypothetical protein
MARRTSPVNALTDRHTHSFKKVRANVKKSYIVSSAVGACLLIVGFSGGVLTGIKRGIPFVAEKEQWTVGIYFGESPFDFDPSKNKRNPVIRAEDVTDVAASFVADPFLIHEDGTWFLFFEVYNLGTSQGDLAVATSKNAKKWEYQQVVLDESFHLTCPIRMSSNQTVNTT